MSLAPRIRCGKRVSICYGDRPRRTVRRLLMASIAHQQSYLPAPNSCDPRAEPAPDYSVLFSASRQVVCYGWL